MTFEDTIEHIQNQIELAERRIELAETSEQEELLDGQIAIYRECLSLIEEMTL